MNKQILALCLIAGAALTSFARPTVLSLKENIQDSTIVYPQSFETDTQELMKNWYLQNYAVVDRSGANLSDVPTSDKDFIARLQKMPTVIEMPYNGVVRSYINMYTQRRRQLVEEMLGLSLYYMPFFEQALEKEGVPLELKYLPVIAPRRRNCRQEEGFLGHIFLSAAGNARICACVYRGKLCDDLLQGPQPRKIACTSAYSYRHNPREQASAFRADIGGAQHPDGGAPRA